MSSHLLTGRWVGHYLQREKPFPITADLIEAGERLSGFMYDGEPDKNDSLSQVIAEAGLPPDAGAEIEANLREMVPDAPTGPVRYVSHLPSNSVLQGRRTGPTVYFLKSYQGASFSGYQVGNHLIGARNADHQVHYEGRLSPDGQVLEGRWWIDANPEQGTPMSEGLFNLRRAEATERLEGQATGAEQNKKRPWWRFWS
jgi:hypothetical protein